MTAPKPTLGSLLRGFRRERHWTLREMSRRTGIPPSTLAKVEYDRLSLTYERLVQLDERVQLPISLLFSPATDSSGAQATAPMVSARRSVGRLADAIRTSTPGYDSYELCAELRQKRLLPTLMLIRVREPGELQRGVGEAFFHVLRGSVEFHTEFYEPVRLTTGESVYIDASMAHACVAAADCEEATVLRVVGR